ncbi:hypothetical protein [Leptolyngbya sp. AN02str]
MESLSQLDSTGTLVCGLDLMVLGLIPQVSRHVELGTTQSLENT